MTDMFLTKEEVAILTGRKYKRLQIEQLRKIGLPFWVNAVNAPVVPRSAIEGGKKTPVAPKPQWIPSVLLQEKNKLLHR